MTATLESQGLATVVEILRSQVTIRLVTNDDDAVARRLAELTNQVAILTAENDALRSEVSRLRNQQS